MIRQAILKVIIALVLVASSTNAQSIDDVKKCITFIYLPNSKGELEPKGTAFFIGIDDTLQDLTYVYVVTAKHVLWDEVKKAFVPDAWLRLNKNEGDAAFVRIPMRTSGVNRNIYTHTDSTVDLVVVAGVPNQDKYSFRILPLQIIRTSQDLKKSGLTEGTDVFIPALFVPHTGEHKNYPIVRFGKIALVSDEQIIWDGLLQRLYLIESISIVGHSGAPVFLWFQPLAKPGTLMSYEEKRIRLLGVIQGYFEYERTLGFRKSTIIPTYGAHTGISAVVPVDLLQEILFGTEATKDRK